MDAITTVFGARADEGVRALTPAYRAAAAALAHDPPRVQTEWDARQLRLRLAAAAPDGPVPAYYEEYEGWEPLFPMRPHDAWHPAAPAYRAAPGEALLDWCVVSAGDFLGLDLESALHPPMLHYLGAMKALEPALVRLLEAVPVQGQRTLDPRLALQLQSIAEDLQRVSFTARMAVEAEATIGAAIAEERAAARAAREAESDARVIVLGERARPGQWLLAGVDQHGRLLGITADSAQMIAIVGSTGSGKTHLERVIIEGSHFNMPGLNCLDGPQRVIVSEIDYSRGKTRRQMLSQFFPNPDPQQLAQLERDFGYRADGDEHFHDGTLLCLPGAEGRLREELSSYCERGLEVRPIQLGLGDLSARAYRALLLNAGGAGDGGRAAYWGTVEALIAESGDSARPVELAELISKTTLRSDVKDPLIRRLRLLDKLVDPEARLNDIILEPKPVFVLLESTMMSPDLLLPVQSIVEGALRRPLRDGRDPKRVFVNDEHNKRSGNAVVDADFREGAQERRHNLDTRVIDAQRPSGLDRPFLGGATIVVVFRLLSRREIRVMKDCYSVLEAVPDEVFLNLPPRRCVMASMESTGPDAVYIVDVRPTASYAGGETRRG